MRIGWLPLPAVGITSTGLLASRSGGRLGVISQHTLQSCNSLAHGGEVADNAGGAFVLGLIRGGTVAAFDRLATHVDGSEGLAAQYEGVA